MTEEINVLSRTQIINVEPTSGAVSIINAGPVGPGGPIGSATGSVILPGASPPLPSDGAVGNYWLDQTADILYGPKGTVAPVWPIALYGAQTPPALLGENRRTTNPPFATTLLPVNIDIPTVLDVKVYLHLYCSIQAGAVYVFECRMDGVIVGRFAYPVPAGGQMVNGIVILRGVPAGQHTISAFPSRNSGSGNCSFPATAQVPAYLAVYKDRA